ncbi:hypothetical protein ABCR94_25020 [Streptomyces sp. 21So2-11]
MYKKYYIVTSDCNPYGLDAVEVLQQGGSAGVGGEQVPGLDQNGEAGGCR